MDVRAGCRVQVFCGGEFVPVVLRVLGSAQGEILSAQYAWKWYAHSPKRRVHRLTLAVQAAAKRGLAVRVILNMENPKFSLCRENAATAALLGKAGVKIKFGRRGVPEHSKFWIIDRKVLVVTSHNVTMRSATCNSELGVVIWSELVARDAAGYFEKLWLRS